jgi:hypothetical protein
MIASAEVRSVVQILTARMADLRLSSVAIAGLVNLDASTVGKYVRGAAPLPIAHVPLWCRALNLEGEQAAEFTRAVYLAHCPPEARALFHQQETALTDARLLIAHYEDVVATVAPLILSLSGLRNRTRPPGGGP